MQLNGRTIVDRFSRPSVSQRVGLRTFFLNNGSYQDPVEVSSVSIFKLINNISPCSVLETTSGLLDPLQIPLMNFQNSSTPDISRTNTSTSAFDPSNYVPGVSSYYGIFKQKTGEYVCVLDGTTLLSGVFNGSSIANAASAVNVYIDVWTVKLLAGSDWKTIINEFRLYDDTFLTLTQPLLLTTRNYLTPKTIKFGSKVDLKITTEIGIQNKNLDESIRNIFKDSVILSPQIEIQKVNDNMELSSNVVVSSFADTSAFIDITPDNTMVFNWDTNQLKTHAATLVGNMGSLTGSYIIRAKYTILNETKISPIMNLIMT